MNQNHKSFVFFGTPTVARDTLAALLAHGYTPALVVTAPDAPRGRGLALTPSPTRVLAEAHGIPVLTPHTLNADVVAALRAASCEYALVVAYGKILPEALIALFPRGMLNVHYSLLPAYRGAAPLEAALRAGERETGVTIQKVVRELDAGDIIAQEAVAIGPDETARELRPRLIALGADLLIRTLPAYLAGTLEPRAQDPAHVSYAPKFKKEDGLISLNAPAQENWYTYCAYADTIGTYFMHQNKRIKIVAAHYKNGTFAIERVIPEGKREMAYADFVRR